MLLTLIISEKSKVLIERKKMYTICFWSTNFESIRFLRLRQQSAVFLWLLLLLLLSAVFQKNCNNHPWSYHNLWYYYYTIMQVFLISMQVSRNLFKSAKAFLFLQKSNTIIPDPKILFHQNTSKSLFWKVSWKSFYAYSYRRSYNALWYYIKRTMKVFSCVTQVWVILCKCLDIHASLCKFF